jgi:hypothetical protein
MMPVKGLEGWHKGVDKKDWIFSYYVNN